VADRLLGIVVSGQNADALDALLVDEVVEAAWCVWSGDGIAVYDALVDAGGVEPLLDQLQQRFGHDEKFRAILISLAAVLPRPKEEPPPEEEEVEAPEEPPKRVPLRVSRAELYEEVAGGAKLNRLFLVQVVLATIVAAIGIFRDMPTAVIGAMVIAPLLGPNIALALGTTLGDLDLIRKSIRTTFAGLLLAFVMAALYGTLLGIDITGSELSARTSVELSDILLALASGVAGTLAYTTRVSTALVGVMVAIALMPPTVVAGALFGAGEWRLFSGAALLLSINVVCVNLAAVVTFLPQGFGRQYTLRCLRSRSCSIIPRRSVATSSLNSTSTWLTCSSVYFWSCSNASTRCSRITCCFFSWAGKRSRRPRFMNARRTLARYASTSRCAPSSGCGRKASSRTRRSTRSSFSEKTR